MTQPNVKRSLSKLIHAPAEKVFDSWLIPAVVGKWMFGPAIQKETVVELINKVRPRGDFNYTVKRGGQDVVHSGIYRVIDRAQRLDFSWKEGNAAESEIQVRFEADGEHTKMKVSLILDASLSLYADAIKQQWAGRCTALAALLSK